MTTLAIFSNLMSQADWRTGHKEVPALRLTDLDVAHPHPHPHPDEMRLGRGRGCGCGCGMDVDVEKCRVTRLNDVLIRRT